MKFFNIYIKKNPLMHLENQHSLKDVLREMVDTMKWKEKLNETSIRQIWSEKMGTTINQYTREMNLRKGKLFITITSASLKNELSYDREKIREMMNRELGGDFVTDVIIRWNGEFTPENQVRGKETKKREKYF